MVVEAVNYLVHYGLQRGRLGNGRYECVQPEHSWNSNHPLGRVLLFELTHHSDHHAHPNRTYPMLRNIDAAPSLPTGYPGIILLDLVPPVLKRVMARQLELETKRISALSMCSTTLLRANQRWYCCFPCAIQTGTG